MSEDGTARRAWIKRAPEKVIGDGTLPHKQLRAEGLKTELERLYRRDDSTATTVPAPPWAVQWARENRSSMPDITFIGSGLHRIAKSQGRKAAWGRLVETG